MHHSIEYKSALKSLKILLCQRTLAKKKNLNTNHNGEARKRQKSAGQDAEGLEASRDNNTESVQDASGTFRFLKKMIFY